MTSGYKLINPKEFQEKLFHLIDNEWFLITSGITGKFNTMTASWGGFGILWNKPVCFVFVRPTRFTYEFMETNELFTMSFFSEEYRKKLSLLGTVSGRDRDKIAETGLTPLFLDDNSITFEEARLIFGCKKIYFNDLVPANFLDTGIGKHYKSNDYHRMYIGEITNILEKK